MYNYCTLFDINYLTRGLVMYESLKKHSDKFHLYIFAFDSKCLDLLKKLNLKHVTVISLEEFEDEKLLAVKDQRSAGEYCWTCTPSIIKYTLENYNVKNCTYIEADLYFFSNPAVLIDEMADNSILITEHRYSKKYDKSLRNGKYCVQFLTFKNDIHGMEAIEWWRNSCIDWCYARYEDGKFGDQKYLDDWTTRFHRVHVLKHLGGGVAPWNIQQYKLEDNSFELVFFHFHGFKYIYDNKVDLGGYKLRKKDIEILYKPYIAHLEQIKSYISFMDESYSYAETADIKLDWKIFLRYLKRLAKRSYTVYDKDYILKL